MWGKRQHFGGTLRASAFVLAVLAAVSVPASAGGSQTLRGSYDWSNGGSDELSAEFEPAGDGRWTVRFEFVFSGERHAWNGTAEGSLADGGSIAGSASWDESGRNWVFEATLNDGLLEGTHAEVREGRKSGSGSFRLSRPAGSTRQPKVQTEDLTTTDRRRQPE